MKQYRRKNARATEQEQAAQASAVTAGGAEEQVRAQSTAVAGRVTDGTLQTEALRKLVAELMDDEEFVERYVLPSATVQRRVIENFLRDRRKQSGVRLLSGEVGVSAMAPQRKPRNLSEAKALADLLLKD